MTGRVNEIIIRAVTNNQIIAQYQDLRPIIIGGKISIIEICL